MKKIAVCSVIFLTSLANLSYATIPGLYLGAGAGLSRLDTPNEYLYDDISDSAQKKSKKLGGLGARAFIGYNFNEYLGLEFGAAQYAKSSYKTQWASDLKATQNYKLRDLDLVAKAYLPISDSGLSVYALGGAAYVESKMGYSQTIPGITNADSTTTHKVLPKYGVGISYDVPATPFTTNLELSRIQGKGDIKDNINLEDPDSKAIPSANMLTLNVAYNFG